MSDLLKFTRTTLTGGGATAVDGISATALVGEELCWATVSDVEYLYRMNATSGAAADGINIIIPVVGTVGDKRWILQGKKVGSGKTYVDHIEESTAAHGVVIDGLPIKDAGFNLGSDADGDMYYRASSALARLAKGAALALPRMNAGATAPEWGAAGQIAFPAVQNASADVNTLDDYEEGTWTATLICGTSGTITVDTSFDTMSYTKVGRMVTVCGGVHVASVSSPVGELRLNGLPFAAGTGSEWSHRTAVSIYASGLEATGTTSMQGYILPNVTTIFIYHFTAGEPGLAAADVKAGSDFFINATYFA